MHTFKTPKGTELPILNLSGKDYLEVKYRLVWFREEHPTWGIETELVVAQEKTATAKAIVRDDGGRIIAMSHKTENVQGFPDFMEKAETGAIGRALALIGYGTQFCADELDEGERIVDSPAQRTAQAAPIIPKVSTPSKTTSGDFVISFGKKYIGKRLKDLLSDEVFGYIQWLEDSAQKKKQPLDSLVIELKEAAYAFYGLPQTTESDVPF